MDVTMKSLYLLIAALLATVGNAFAMQRRDLNIPEGEQPPVFHAIQRRTWNPHGSLEKQIAETFDKENSTVVDLPKAYNRFNAWIALFTSDRNPQNLKTQFASLRNTYTTFARALSRDTTQQAGLAELRQNIESVGRLVNGSASVVTSANATNNNNNV
jgi:hypothetical protein